MKLKDFVFNSFRVRGRKKKTTPVETDSTLDIPTGCLGLDKHENRSPVCIRGRSRTKSIESNDFAEANWQGNALYRGLESDGNMEEKSPLMIQDCASYHGVLATLNSNGFSSQLTMTSNTWQSRLTVPQNFDSSSLMAPISEMGREPYTIMQHDHHNRYHKNDQYHSQYKGRMIVAQNKHTLDDNPEGGKQFSSHKSEHPAKPETGFFRKSIASFRSMRRDSSKKHFSSKENGVEDMSCGLRPQPYASLSSPEKTPNIKRFARARKKGSKLFSKFRGNKENNFSSKHFENPWVLGSDTQSPSKEVMGPIVSKYAPYERSYVRECSAESCPSRPCGFREDSSVRDLDFSSFESASLTSYESDLSSGKFHRPRSRIKTNPWLPSPQSSNSVGSLRGVCELRESIEHFVLMEERDLTSAEAVSTEHDQYLPIPCHSSSLSNKYFSKTLSSCRSQSLKDTDMTFNLSPPADLLTIAAQKTVCSTTESFIPGSAPKFKKTTFNDLSCQNIQSSPEHIVSPNTEFIRLSDHLEQLATNISFEYEDTLDTTMESVSAGRENCQTCVQDTSRDDNTNEITFLKSDRKIKSTHSPDSGIGGIYCSDGDATLSPVTAKALKVLSAEYLPLPENQASVTNSSACASTLQELQMDNIGNISNTSHCQIHDFPNRAPIASSCRTNIQHIISKNKRKREKSYVSADTSQTAVYESDTDNAARKHNKGDTSTENELEGSVLSRDKLLAKNAGRTGQSVLMVEECLDVTWHRSYHHLRRPLVPIATVDTSREHTVQLECADKQIEKAVSESIPDIVCKTPRPNTLIRNFSLAMPIKMNNMEKSSSQREQTRSSWTDEFDFPRNITVSECLESPTENWHWDGQSSLSISQDEKISPVTRQVVSCGNKGNSQVTDLSGRSCIQTEDKLVVMFKERTVLSQDETRDRVTDNLNVLNCNVETPCTRYNDSISKMVDACVQTEFDDDDDDAMWDELDLLDDIDEAQFDPSQSSQFWSLGGTMQGALHPVLYDPATEGHAEMSDTYDGYDYKACFASGDIEERAPFARLCFEGASFESESKNVISPGSTCSHTLSRDEFSLNAHHTSSLSVNGDEQQYDQLRLSLYNGNLVHLTPETSWLGLEIHTEPTQPSTPQRINIHKNKPTAKENLVEESSRREIQRKQSVTEAQNYKPKQILADSVGSNAMLLDEQTRKDGDATPPPGRSVTGKATNILLSDIKVQFEDVFKQLHDSCESQANSDTKILTPQNSKPCLNPVRSNRFACHHISNIHTLCCENMDFEANETNDLRSIMSDNSNAVNGILADDKYADFPSSNVVVQRTLGKSFNGNDITLNNEIESDGIQRKSKHNFQYLRNYCLPAETNVNNSFNVPLKQSSAKTGSHCFPRNTSLNTLLIKNPSLHEPSVRVIKKTCSDQLRVFLEDDPHCSREPLAYSSFSSSSSSSSVNISCLDKMFHMRKQVVPDCTQEAPLFANSHQTSEESMTHFFLPMPKEKLGITESSLLETANIYSEHRTLPGTFSDGLYCLARPILQLRCPEDIFMQKPSLPPQLNYPETLSTNLPTTTTTEKSQINNDTRCLAEKVRSLCQEKDMVLLKIQKAQHKEKLLQEQRKTLQRNMHTLRKDALLQTLYELKSGLEEQSKRLNQRRNANRKGESPFGVL